MRREVETVDFTKFFHEQRLRANACQTGRTANRYVPKESITLPYVTMLDDGTFPYPMRKLVQ
jgi:hypothetical protein